MLSKQGQERRKRASIAPRIGPTSTALANTSGERQPRAIGSGGHTPPPHQPRLLREPSSPGFPPANGRLFSGRGSRLDAFSGYPLRRGCAAYALWGFTPPPHQPFFLWDPSSLGNPLAHGRLFSGRGSRLDAFSGYPLRRSCPACPAGQPVDQRPRRPVPFVLGAPSPQAAHTPRG